MDNESWQNKNQIALLCCVKAIETLNSNFDYGNLPSFAPANIDVTTIRFLKKQLALNSWNENRLYFSKVVPIAKYLILITSTYTGDEQITGDAILLSKYMYRFGYFYMKYHNLARNNFNANEPDFTRSDINYIALHTIFRLIRY